MDYCCHCIPANVVTGNCCEVHGNFTETCFALLTKHLFLQSFEGVTIEFFMINDLAVSARSGRSMSVCL